MSAMLNLAAACEDYYLVERVLSLADDKGRVRPEIPALAAAVNLDQSGLDQLFRRWAGVEARKFFELISRGHTRKAVKAAALSPQSALFPAVPSFRPGEIRYSFQPTPFGRVLIASHDLGICNLAFVDPGEEAPALDRLRQEWPDSDLLADHRLGRQIAANIFTRRHRPIRLAPKGSRFQVEVWRALSGVPPGRLVSYQEIAGRLGRAGATRAVAGAIAKNPLAILVPCHRVIKKNGEIHQYRWGSVRKQAMIGREAVKRAIWAPPEKFSSPVS